MRDLWKDNWPETRERFLDWWEGRGTLLGCWGSGVPSSLPAREAGSAPAAPATAALRHSDPGYVASALRYDMARRSWPAEVLPAAWADIGTLSLVPCLGGRQAHGEDNVWYEAVIADPESHPKLVFDPSHPEWQALLARVRESSRAAMGNYFIAMPGICSNLDVLAELRGMQELLYDMLDRPEWVRRALCEIEAAWKTAFDLMRPEIALDDGSMAFGFFMLWGIGRVGLLQCDVSATISGDMFGEFVLPRLEAECAFLDRSLYHVDGPQALRHLDAVLALEDLDAVEWTPGPQVPDGGDSSWYGLYRKILEAGKSVWIAHVKPGEIAPLLDAIGTQGVYLCMENVTEEEFALAERELDRFRPGRPGKGPAS
jgi:hypothetical protein